MGLNPTDHEFHINICDLLMLTVCLEDQEDGSSPTDFRRALKLGGHECTLGDEFPQMVKRDALHAECSSYGTKVNIPQVVSVLAVESLP